MESLLQKLAMLLAVAVCTALPFAGGENLQLIDTGTRLPVGRSFHSAVYDGDDAIYIIGGLNRGVIQSSVLKYSLESGQLEENGQFTPLMMGAVVMRGNEILYLGGWNGSAESSSIYSYSTRNGSHSEVARLPNPTRSLGLAWDPVAEHAYTFGGWGGGKRLNHVHRYSARTHATDLVGVLPLDAEDTAAVWTFKGVGYIFGGYPGSHHSYSDVFRFNSAMGHVQTLLPLPGRLFGPCAVMTDRYAYILDWDVFQFDPSTDAAHLLTVKGWRDLVNEAGCVYVPKLDRIYMIGGLDTQNVDSDQIAYLEWTSDADSPKRAPLLILTIVGFVAQYVAI